MTPERNSPKILTLGIQLVAMSTVLAFIARISWTARKPMPAIATSRNDTSAMIFERIERLANMSEIFWLARWRCGNDGAANRQGSKYLVTIGRRFLRLR